MVGTKSRGYSNSGRFSEGEYSMPFFVPVTALVLSALRITYFIANLYTEYFWT